VTNPTETVGNDPYEDADVELRKLREDLDAQREAEAEHRALDELDYAM
jgi:hypothetical protein